MAGSNGTSFPIGRKNVPFCNIAFAMNKAARVIENPTIQNWKQLKRIFLYLKRITSYEIVYRGGEALKVYNDADYAGNKTTRHSTTGVVATLCHGAVS